jgi:hypothetical protein
MTMENFGRGGVRSGRRQSFKLAAPAVLISLPTPAQARAAAETPASNAARNFISKSLPPLDLFPVPICDDQLPHIILNFI